MGDSARIPGPPAPKLLAGGRVVPGDAVTAGDENFLPALERKRNGRGVRFPGFFARIIGTNNLPDFLAGSRVERQQERVNRTVLSPAAIHRHVPLEDLQIQPALVKRRAARKRPLKRKLAVFFLNVSGSVHGIEAPICLSTLLR